MKQYLCPRCDDLLDENYPNRLCLNCGGYVRGIVPAKRGLLMSEIIEWSLQSVIKGLLILSMGLTALFFMLGLLSFLLYQVMGD